MKTSQCILLVLSILFSGRQAVSLAADAVSFKQSDKIKDAELAIHRFKLPNGMRAELFAAEPLLANPVAFCIDEQGRIFVAETFRLHHGVEDNRGHMNWLLDDLSAETVADRIAYTRKWLKDDIQNYAVEQERVRLVVDQDGDGQADQSTVFADGFNAIEDGLAAGVLAHEGTVYLTCIPKLWRLKDTDGDGLADEKTALADGFGVRFAFTGHDLHGLVVGPDGRLYFSVGDRGYNVEVKGGRRLAQPDQGAVFRCELDGSQLEVFCQGLRNPQELAFDDLGNLFTGDNNSDSGDQARWVYLPEGSDSGWRMYYQYHPERGPWNREKLWHTKHPGQAAYLVPPVAHFANGPSGLAYYPGTGLDQKYAGHFFLVDFRGQSSNSGVRSFSLISQGASFELVNAEEFIWNILATDIEFGLDGAIYLSDWVDGWNNMGQGRIYRFRDNQFGDSDGVRQVAALMKDGFASRSPRELLSLLDHSDYRIRLRSQFELVKQSAAQSLIEVAMKSTSLHPRVHAIWGLGQLARKSPDQLKPLLPLFEDKDPEIRSQITRVCGDVRYAPAITPIRKLIKDPSPRVRSLASVAAGRLRDQDAVPRLLEALAENADTDPTLRHCLVMGLVGSATPEQLVATSSISNVSIRLGAVVALRRLKHSGLAKFLNDSDPLVVAEAARALHDLRIDAALPELAKLIDHPTLPDHVMRRAISANYLLGSTENAESVAAFAGNPIAEDHLRIEAIAELSDWNHPGPLDRVTHQYRRLADREVPIADVIRPWMRAMFVGNAQIQEAGIQLATRNGITDVEPFLVDILKDGKSVRSSTRLAALIGLQSLKSQQFPAVLDIAVGDADPAIRVEAQRLLAGIDPERAIKLFAAQLEGTSVLEQQSAATCLGQMNSVEADIVLERWMDELLAGRVSPMVQLELLTAARERGTKMLDEKVATFDARRDLKDHLRDYRESMLGGNIERGRQVFFEKTEASCRRCHKVQGEGGDVGPDLSRIGRDKNRDYLLEAIVDPNKQIAKGFETVILEMADGRVFAGIIKQETEQSIQMIQPDGKLVTLQKSEIEDRTTGKSGMPEDLLKKLNKHEIRDLVEYLSSLNSDSNAAAHGGDNK